MTVTVIVTVTNGSSRLTLTFIFNSTSNLHIYMVFYSHFRIFLDIRWLTPGLFLADFLTLAGWLARCVYLFVFYPSSILHLCILPPSGSASSASVSVSKQVVVPWWCRAADTVLQYSGNFIITLHYIALPDLTFHIALLPYPEQIPKTETEKRKNLLWSTVYLKGGSFSQVSFGSGEGE